MTWEDEAYNLARPVLTKLTMAGADSKKRHKLIKQYIRSLEEYEQVLLGEWITSYCSDNKVWYGFVWKLILDSLNEQYASRSPNSTTGTARGGIDFAKAKQEIKCENVALKNGVELKSIGNRMVAICPFHSDTQPSFYIYLYTNTPLIIYKRKELMIYIKPLCFNRKETHGRNHSRTADTSSQC